MSTPTTGHRVRRCLLALALTVSFSACAPQFSNHGYIPPEEDLDLLTVGVDTRASVEDAVGAPVTGGVADDSGFYYVRSRTRTFGALAPRTIERQVLAISFDDTGVVSNVERFGLERGQVVPISRRVTTTGVSNSGFLRQLLGNIGRFNPAGLAG